MVDKFPCDTCEEKDICEIVCLRLYIYSKKHPHSKKAKEWIEGNHSERLY